MRGVRPPVFPVSLGRPEPSASPRLVHLPISLILGRRLFWFVESVCQFERPNAVFTDPCGSHGCSGVSRKKRSDSKSFPGPGRLPEAPLVVYVRGEVSVGGKRRTGGPSRRPLVPASSVRGPGRW